MIYCETYELKIFFNFMYSRIIDSEMSFHKFVSESIKYPKFFLDYFQRICAKKNIMYT